MGEQALIIHLHNLGIHADELGVDALDMLIALQELLTNAIEGAAVAEVDGHEIALDDSEAFLWVYGDDAKAMLKAALPALCPSPLAPGGRAILQYKLREDDAAHEVFLLSDLCARRNG